MFGHVIANAFPIWLPLFSSVAVPVRSVICGIGVHEVGEGGNGSKRKDAAYMSLSPGKGHQQAARNTRNLDNNQKNHYNDLKGGDEDFDMQNDIAPSDMSKSNENPSDRKSRDYQ